MVVQCNFNKMTPITTWLSEEGYQKYQEAIELTDSVEGEDESQPYLNKYKSRDLLKVLKNKIEDCIEDQPSDVLLNSLMAVLSYQLGVNFMECEEISTGEEYLKKSLALLDTDVPCYITLSIAVLNQLAIIWSGRSSHEQARDYLQLAESRYKEQCEISRAPIHYAEIWTSSETECDDREKRLDNLHTLTLFYLAQVYGSLDCPSLSAKYCHATLGRQIQSKAYDPRDWSLSCATLSQYYITQDQYELARYCLACAEYINIEAVKSLEKDDNIEEKSRKEEAIYKSQANIYRCWAKYGLNLLKDSHAINVSGETEGKKPSSPIDVKTLEFPGFEVSVLEEQVTFLLAKDYGAAKKIFVFTISCLEKGKQFYKLDGYVSDFIEITQDTSQLYKYLAFFDNEFENRCKMHKRRIDMLNAILIELNPQHFLQLCRQLTFEIAEIYSEMGRLKKAIVEENPQKFSASSVKKINFLLLQSIKYYQGFIDSYMREGALPSTFEDDDVRGILLSHMCMAKQNSSYVTNDKETKLKYMLKEKECYQFIVSYCNEHKDMPAVFEQELSVCEEMLALFHAKMNNMLDKM